MSAIRWIKEAYDRFTIQFYLIPDCFKTQRMCIKAVEKCSWGLYYIPSHFKTQRCVNGPMKINQKPWNLSQIILRQRRCVKKLLKKVYGGCPMSHVILRPKGCVKGLLLGTHEDIGIGVFLRMKKKRQKNCF